METYLTIKVDIAVIHHIANKVGTDRVFVTLAIDQYI